MIHLQDLLDHVVQPTLQDLADAEPRLYTPAAAQLLLGTYLAEALYRSERGLASVIGAALEAAAGLEHELAGV